MTARWRAVSRVLAAVLGGLALAVTASVRLSLWLPAPRTLGVAVGILVAIPIWVAAMSVGFLAKSAWRPWALYLGASAVFGVLNWCFR